MEGASDNKLNIFQAGRGATAIFYFARHPLIWDLLRPFAPSAS
jgi:hypothetical protein